MITLFTGYDEEPKDQKKDQEAQAGEEESAQKSGFFSRMRSAVTRTRETFSSRINDIVALTREVDEPSLEDLETALIMSDIGVQTTTEILNALRERARASSHRRRRGACATCLKLSCAESSKLPMRAVARSRPPT